MPKVKRKTKKRVAFSSRQKLIFFALIVILPLLLVAVYMQHNLRQFAQVADKPNIIVIMTDDQRADDMETMPIIKDRLGGHGITFTNMFITTPICCPSRSSFLTGLYAHNTNVWTNQKATGSITHFLPHENETIGVWMKNAGYKTALIGKYLNGYDNMRNHVPEGWDDWFVMTNPKYYDYSVNDNGKIRRFEHKNSDYSTDVLGQQAVSFVQQTQEPFFLVFTPKAPHGDGGDGADNDDSPAGLNSPPPAPVDKGTCNTISDWQVPPSFNQLPTNPVKWEKKLNKVSLNQAKAFRQAQLCTLKDVDRITGQLLDALGDRLQNTVVIFYSDNGYSYGEHKYVKKDCFFEECARVPMIISYPKLTPQAATSSAFATNIDLAPTIAELAGITIPVKVDGQSLVPILTDPSASIQDDILLEIHNPERNFKGSAIRTQQYKYIEYEDGGKEFYDLSTDPYELQNQANNPQYQAIIPDLSAKLHVLEAK